MKSTSVDLTCVNTIRFLSADMVQQANSGHPGLPMGAAPMAYTLWQRVLKHNPANPRWFDRDRFVLSAGHGSALIYSLLHLFGYDLPLSELKQFRQWGSRTPGHPESTLTPGVETTTGPLGQGIANAVGMAIAEANLAARFNRPGHALVNHFTYALAGDGCLMEGVAAEACSLAGHLRLGKLILMHDDNRISLAGTTSLCFTEDSGARLEAYGWHVQHVEDGNDLEAIEKALLAAQKATDKPSLIMVHTHIGYGAPHKQDSFEAHGSPLGVEELKAAKEHLGWPVEPSFYIPADAQENFRLAGERGNKQEADWNRRWAEYKKAFPDLAVEFQRRMSNELPSGWDSTLPVFPPDPKGIATRKAGETVLQALAAQLPELMGGSADLDPSTFTWIKNAGDFQASAKPPEGVQGAVGGPWGWEGRNVHFGVREHGMGAIVNGMTLHGGLRGFGSTFLVFADYMRPALRLSAIMEQGSIWVFTHDSFMLGEDGPTHQPVEQLASLRIIPHLLLIRPCDANETAWAWKVAIENRNRPTALALTRQNVPTLDRSKFASAEGVQKGAYVLNPDVQKPDVILMATGSEVMLIVAAQKLLAEKGIQARLVSMPCWELFLEQSDDYRESVLPASVKRRLGVEAGVSFGWSAWVGEEGALLTMDRYGASAPAAVLQEKFGFTAEHVAQLAQSIFDGKKVERK
jgi:transketolase